MCGWVYVDVWVGIRRCVGVILHMQPLLLCCGYEIWKSSSSPTLSTHI